MTPLSVLSIAVLLFVAALGAVIYIARRAAHPRRRKVISYELTPEGNLRLERNLETALDGHYGLWSNGTHLLAGEVLETSPTHVVRRLERATGDQTGSGLGRWTGHIFRDPRDLGHSHEEVSYLAPHGRRQAWLFPGETQALWAIHIHGIHTSRVSVLRGVSVFHDFGFNSLVPAYFADGENQPEKGSLPTTFGIWESEDVETALDYAVSHGARKIILVGWSMGGTIALRLAQLSAHRSIIAGTVLISPATSWRQLLVLGITKARIPSAVAAIVPALLQSRVGAKLAGLPTSIPFQQLDWTSGRQRIGTPTLLIHSAGDQEVPIELSRSVARWNPTVQLEEFPAVPHQMEYNNDPERFNRVIAEWLKGLDWAK